MWKPRMAVSEDASALRLLAATGLCIFAALGALTLLCVNFPDRFQTPTGVHRHAVSFFFLLWSYPRHELSPAAFQAGAVATLTVLWGAYLWACWTVRRLSEQGKQAGLVVAVLCFAAAFVLVLAAFFPPLLSGDVFHYAMQGRLHAVHGFNPYVVPASRAADDPFLAVTLWSDRPTQYGPVWIQLSAFCVWLGRDSIVLTALCFKALAGLSHLLGALFVLLLARRLAGGDGVLPLLFYAWNPVLLIESAGTAHNDGVMMTLALAGVYLVVRRNLFLGVAVMLGSVLIKYTTLLLLVLVVIHVLSRQSGQRLGTAVRLGIFSLFIVTLVYSPFLSGAPDPLQLVAGISPSLNPMPNSAGLAAQWIAAEVLKAFGLAPQQYVALLLSVIFAVFVLLLLPGLTAAGATMADVFARFALAALVYTFVVHGGSFAWYLVCPLTALALGPPTRGTFYLRLVTVGLAMGLTFQTTILIDP